MTSGGSFARDLCRFGGCVRPSRMVRRRVGAGAGKPRRGRHRRETAIPHCRQGRSRCAAAWLRRDWPYVATAVSRTCEKPHRDCAGPARVRQVRCADSGYTKKEMAQDIHALVKSLGYTKVKRVGHDIGLMVAYAYAAQYPSEVDRIVLMDAFLPGVGDWKSVWLLRDLWHFHFYGKTPLRWSPAASGSISTISGMILPPIPRNRSQKGPEILRQAYAQPGRMKRASRSSARSKRTRTISRALRKPGCRCDACSVWRESWRRFPDRAGQAGCDPMSKASSSRARAIG